MKDLQQVKLSQEYPVIVNGKHVGVIPEYTNGTIVKITPTGTLVKFGSYTVVINENHLITPSVHTKNAGYKSLTELSGLLGKSKSGHPKVSRATLRNWFFNKFELFNAILNSAKGKQK